MNEEFLYYLWTYQLIDANIKTTTGENIIVLSPGTRNFDSGPDFFNAKIKIGETCWAGNVEIHVNSSDWFKHNHQNNPVYDNIILHVVYSYDKPVYRKNSEFIFTLELKNIFDHNILDNYKSFLISRKSISCHKLIHNIKYFDKLIWFDSLMAERLEKKSTEIFNILKHSNNNLLQVFYQRLARSFGYTSNADSMELLASSLELNILTKHSDNLMQVEALLYGQSGLLSKNYTDDYPLKLINEYTFLRNKYRLTPLDGSMWKFMRMRPVSFPTIRISQLANIIYNSSGLLNKILDLNALQDVMNLFSVSASPYWDNHYRFNKIAPGKSKKLGKSSIEIILINTIIPFLFVYGKTKNDSDLQNKAINWLNLIKPESNSITQEFNLLGIKSENAMQSQALIQLKNNYCTKKRCLNCRFGNVLLNKS